MFALHTLRGSSPQATSSDHESRSRSASSARSNAASHHRGQDTHAYRHRAINPYQRIVDEIVAEERNIRKGLREVDGHPAALLRFCSSCIEVALTLLEQSTEQQEESGAVPSVVVSQNGGDGADALQTAYAIACHVETLLRNGVESRRRYNNEDWLNLCRAVVRKMMPTEALSIETKRVALLSQTLQIVARICLLRNEFEDGLRAFEDSMTASGTTLMDCRLGTLLNYLSIADQSTCTAADAARTLRLASDAVALAEQEVQSVIAEADTLMRHGVPSERQRLMERRADVGKMVVTARLRQATAAARFVQLQATSASHTHQQQWWSWPLHRVTLLFAALQTLTDSELDPEVPLQHTVRQAIERWSVWVAQHPSRSASSEVYMQFSDRWRYQCLQSRQWSVMQHLDVPPGDAVAATVCLAERNPMLLGLEMLRMASAMPPIDPSAAPNEAVETVPLPRPTMSFRQERRRRDSSLGAASWYRPSSMLVDASTEVPLLLAGGGSGSTLSTNDAELPPGRRGQAEQSAALRNFTRRAFDICHNYLLLPAAGPTANSRSNSAADGDDVVPSTGSSPCPLPPPQPVAPIRSTTQPTLPLDHGSKHRSQSSSNGATQDDVFCLSLPRCAQSVSPCAHIDPVDGEGAGVASVPADAVPLPTKPASLPRRRRPVES